MTEADMAKLIMPAYIDTAKTFGQLAVGALVLSVAFREKILGETGRKFVTLMMAGSWLLFLVSIGASALYQYLAVKFMIYLLATPDQLKGVKDIWDYAPFLAPAYIYAVMLVSFFLGALLLVLGAAQQLFGARTPGKEG